jgi:hypothetical protein
MKRKRERAETSELTLRLRSLGTSSGLAMGAPELEPELRVRAIKAGVGAPGHMHRVRGARARCDGRQSPGAGAKVGGAGC